MQCFFLHGAVWGANQTRTPGDEGTLLYHVKFVALSCAVVTVKILLNPSLVLNTGEHLQHFMGQCGALIKQGRQGTRVHSFIM